MGRRHGRGLARIDDRGTHSGAHDGMVVVVPLDVGVGAAQAGGQAKSRNPVAGKRGVDSRVKPENDVNISFLKARIQDCLSFCKGTFPSYKPSLSGSNAGLV